MLGFPGACALIIVVTALHPSERMAAHSLVSDWKMCKTQKVRTCTLEGVYEFWNVQEPVP